MINDKSTSIRITNSKNIVLYLVFQKDLLMWVYVLTVYFSFFFSLLLFVLFPSEKKKKRKSNLFTFVLCVCFSKRLVRCMFSKKRGERLKEMEFPVCLCFRIICRLFLSFFLWVDAVFFLCCRLFPYLFIKRLSVCVCVSAFIICCVFAHSSFILFCFFFSFIKRP
jgi:hypothetical protein